jgi:glycosyltransferase involved in cell wall biosynthesis
LASVARVEAPALDVPIDLQASAQLRASCGLKPGQILAVSVGRLVPKKRVDLAIAAAEHARGRARLVIVGDGPERERLEKRATRMGVSSAQVTFAGLAPRPLALAWIRASDVLVHLSEAEGAPTAVREARSMGVPVVACPAGDIAAWARTDPGIVLCAPSAAAVADAILGPMR